MGAFNPAIQSAVNQAITSSPGLAPGSPVTPSGINLSAPATSGIDAPDPATTGDPRERDINTTSPFPSGLIPGITTPSQATIDFFSNLFKKKTVAQSLFLG